MIRMPVLRRLVVALACAIPGVASAQHPADVRFMQGMIGHHAQAVAMAALVPERTTNRSLRLLAERIDVSQKDEIALMSSWLKRHRQDVPDPAEHLAHAMMGHAELMPGMLGQPQMDSLTAAKGARFDSLFLTYMIRHHQGALTMVKGLLASPGAAQDSEIYRFASDVDTDQRAEITRMRALLHPNPPRSRSK